MDSNSNYKDKLEDDYRCFGVVHNKDFGKKAASLSRLRFGDDATHVSQYMS